jgi:cytochrome c556
MKATWMIAVCGCMAIGSATVALAADEPDKILSYRQNLMKSVGANISNIAMVAKGEVTFVGNVAANARAIRDGLNLAGPLFPEGTGKEAGKTRALPSIWQDNAKFVEALKASQSAADAMVAAAETNDLGQIQQAIGALGKTCGGCHENFREEQK